MDIFLQQVINGLTLGAVYAVVSHRVIDLRALTQWTFRRVVLFR